VKEVDEILKFDWSNDSKYGENYTSGLDLLQTPRKVNQYLRGELYLYVDSILSLYLNTTKEELEIYHEFIGKVFSVIQLWMRVFTEKLSESFYNTKKYQKLYLIDFDAALSRCGFEFIDILAKAFGVCPRCVQLYNHFGSAYFYKGNFQLVRYVPGAARGFMYSLINMFGEQRGLESFRNFLLGNSIDEQGKNFYFQI